jgi:glutathione synthase
MNILVLTDHSTHTEHNSFYGIANALVASSLIDQTYVATRGVEENRSFFEGNQDSVLYGKAINTPVNFNEFDGLMNLSDPIDLSMVDFILLRLPRPIPDNFFPFLISVFPEKRIINRPSGIIKTSNKSFLQELKHWCPPIKLCMSWNDIWTFSRQFPIVLKPLEEYGGRGIVKIEDKVVTINGDKYISLDEFKSQYEEKPTEYLAMKFLKNVKLGDKRIVVADGHVLTASLRLPAADQWLCNVSQGGKASVTQPDKKELEIIEGLTPIMKENGIFLFGLDTLVNDDGDRVISEVNTLSVGGLSPAQIETGTDITGQFVKYLLDYCKTIK